MAKILIAEDEPDIRALIQFTLQFAGHEVVATKNGLEAFETALQVIPDLIMMDIRMPQMSGYECLRKNKKGRCNQTYSRCFSFSKRSGTGNSNRFEFGRSGVFIEAICA